MVYVHYQYCFLVLVVVSAIYGLPQQNRAQNSRRNGGRQSQLDDFGFNPDFQGVFVNNNDDSSENPNVLVDDLDLGVQQQSTTTPRAVDGDSSTTTTASPQFRRCMTSCQTVSVYNPVCASDGTTYDNQQRLNCARRCGANIQLVRGGGCTAL